MTTLRHLAESIGYMLIAAFIAGSLGLIDFSICIGKLGDCTTQKDFK